MHVTAALLGTLDVRVVVNTGLLGRYLLMLPQQPSGRKTGCEEDPL
jgi:hypothetical protein